jgi:hypothetical protein
VTRDEVLKRLVALEAETGEPIVQVILDLIGDGYSVDETLLDGLDALAKQVTLLGDTLMDYRLNEPIKSMFVPTTPPAQVSPLAHSFPRAKPVYIKEKS